MIIPEQVEKTLEIYEYYDGPLSSLVLLKDGRKALVEVFNWSHETSELWEIAVLIQDEELAKIKKEKPLVREFLLQKVKSGAVYLWHYKNRLCNSTLMDEVALLEFTKNMGEEYRFEGNADDWNHLLEGCNG